MRRLSSPSPTPIFTTRGATESAMWLRARKLEAARPWHIELALDVVERGVSLTYSPDVDTRFHLNIYPEEWGVFFCHGSRASWIRVTDEAFVHGRDDHRLVGEVTELEKIGELFHELEARHRLKFLRRHALIRANVSGAKAAMRDWLAVI